MRRRGGEEGGERRGEREGEDVAQFAFATHNLRLFCTQFGVIRESGGVGAPDLASGPLVDGVLYRSQAGLGPRTSRRVPFLTGCYTGVRRGCGPGPRLGAHF